MKLLHDKLSKTPVVIMLAMVCCFLWGSAFPCIKIGYRLFGIESGETASQILFAGTRFALAGVLVIMAFSVIEKKLIRPSHPEKIITLSLFQTILQYVPFYIGLAHTTGVKSSIINGTAVFLTILVSCLIFRQEKLTGKKIAGSVLGFAGIVIVNMVGTSMNLNISFLGEGFILISTLSSAFSSSFIKKFSKTANVVMLSGYQFFTGGIIMIVIGLLMGGKLYVISIDSIMLLIYMAFISAAAYTIWSILLKYNDVSKISAYKFMNPVFGVVLSFALLNESSQMGWQTVVALIFVCVGIYIVNTGDKSLTNSFKKS
ncbi:MAG: DMT family transporter [Eubacterium sp.]